MIQLRIVGGTQLEGTPGSEVRYDSLRARLGDSRS